MAFENFPYSNFHDMNLDWILTKIKDLIQEMNVFVNVNEIKYADPLQWNITTQYEKNTIVQDSFGNTYMSKKAVPTGIALTSTAYWLKVADFAIEADLIRANIAPANEGTTTTASAPRQIGDLVWLSGELYKVIAPMIAGDSYVEGSNCEKTTVENLLHELIEHVDSEDSDLNAAITAETAARTAAITEETNARTAAITEETNARSAADTEIEAEITELQDLIARAGKIYKNIDELKADTELEAGAVVATAGYYSAGDGGAALYLITDTATEYTVPLTNGLYAGFLNAGAVNVKWFGARGNTITDDTAAFRKAIRWGQENAVGIFIPAGDYLITQTLTIDLSKRRFLQIYGESSTKTVLRNAASGYLFNIDCHADRSSAKDLVFKNFTMIGADDGLAHSGIKLYYAATGVMENLIFRRFIYNIYAEYSWTWLIRNCQIIEIKSADYEPVYLKSQCNSWLFVKCSINQHADATSAKRCVTINGGMSSITFLSCVFNYGMGVFTNVASGERLDTVNLIGCYFEYLKGAALKANGGTNKNFSVIGCYINASADANNSYGIDNRYIDGLTVEGCYFANFVNYCVNNGNNPSSVLHVSNISGDCPPLYAGHYATNGSAAPTTGAHRVGEFVWRTNPTGKSIGWMCTVAGTPGTWVEIVGT